ncbi:MAG: 4'-phosphopantetheinyl transferase superfamily protein [Solirubrobacteraceae bacterium]|jgi:phosphopantetheinyl transferase (holo-ACP synthase)
MRLWPGTPIGLGVDLERIERFEPDFLESICTPSERAGLSSLDDRDAYCAALRCNKEALAKALGDPIAHDPRRLESPMHWHESRSGPWNAFELAAPSNHTAWLCWRSVPR